MIVVIQDKDGIWIGADSVRGGAELVCKVHEESFGIVAKDGRIEGFDRTGTHYSIDKEIHDIVGSAHSAEEFRVTIRDRYVNDIWAQMAYLLDEPQADSTTISFQNIRSPVPTATKELEERSVLLVTNERGALKLQQLVLTPDSSPLLGGGFRYFISSPSRSGSPEWITIDSTVLRDPRDQKHPSLHQFGLWTDYQKDETWILSHQEEAIRAVLDQATKEFKGSVGPPYAILHVHAPLSKSGSPQPSGLVTEWKSKGKCPSWTYTISGDDDLTRHGTN